MNERIKLLILLGAAGVFTIVLAARMHFVKLEAAGSPALTNQTTKLLRVPTEQQSKNRKWLPVQLSRRWIISNGHGVSLYLPTFVRSFRDGSVYVLDYGDLLVKKFDSTGRFVEAIGSGRGRGPGELSNPTDLELDKTGRLWVADPVNGLISVWNRQGKLIKTIRPPVLPYRVIPSGKMESVFIMPSVAAYLVARYNPTGSITIFDNLFDPSSQSSPIRDGWLGSLNDTSVVIAFLHAGLLAGFNSSGGVAFFVRTIDRTPIAELRVYGREGSTAVAVDPKAAMSALSISVYGSHIYILSGSESNGLRNWMPVDVYSSKDGSYEGSFRIPEICKFAEIAGNSLLSIEDTTVTKWSIYRGHN